MTDEQISKLSAAIMRRVEYEQCIHASSIVDEIGKWVREVMEPKKDWAAHPEKMARAVAYRDALEKALSNPSELYRQAHQDQQRRLQALAQPMGYPATDIVIGRETDALGRQTKIVAGIDPDSKYLTSSLIRGNLVHGFLRKAGFDGYGDYYLTDDGQAPNLTEGVKYRVAE